MSHLHPTSLPLCRSECVLRLVLLSRPLFTRVFLLCLCSICHYTLCPTYNTSVVECPLRSSYETCFAVFFYIYIITCTSHLSFLQDLREQWPLCRLMVMLLNNGKTACVYTCSCRVVFIGFWLSVWEYGQRCECVQQARVWAAASVWVFLCRGAVTAGGGGAVGARRQFTSERHGVAALSPRRAWLAITLTLCTGNFSKQYRTLRRALIAFVSNFKSRILSKTCEPLLLRVWSNRSVYFWIFSKRFGDNVKFSKHSRRCRVNGRSVQHACTTSLVFLLTDFCC